jgi:hypothetical protein
MCFHEKRNVSILEARNDEYNDFKIVKTETALGLINMDKRHCDCPKTVYSPLFPNLAVS